MIKRSLLERTLFEMRIPRTVKGYSCICCGVERILEDENYLRALTTKLYPEIAKMLECTAYCVERNMRTVCEICWKRGRKALLEDIFGTPLDAKAPSVGEFLNYLSVYIKDMSALEIPSYEAEESDGSERSKSTIEC